MEFSSKFLTLVSYFLYFILADVHKSQTIQVLSENLKLKDDHIRQLDEKLAESVDQQTLWKRETLKLKEELDNIKDLVAKKNIQETQYRSNAITVSHQIL